MSARGMLRFAAGLTAAITSLEGTSAASVVIPFDHKANQVAVQIEIRGEPLTFIIDTAVTPSVIDRSTARVLGLSASDAPSGEASGTGSGSAAVFPAVLRDVRLGGTTIKHIEAVAFDMKPLSGKFGRPLHGILGESFLRGRTLVIDYAGHKVSMYDSSGQARRALARCSVRYSRPLTFVPEDVAPKLWLRIGRSRVPVSLDTGSSLGLELYDGALTPHQRELLRSRKPRTVTGARGDAIVADAELEAAVRLGPFQWSHPTVVLSGPKGSPDTRLGNLGNAFLRDKKLLLDYRGMMLGIYDRCDHPHSPARSSRRGHRP